MATFDEEMLDDSEDTLVIMTDEEGNEYYYREEEIITVGEDRYALLVSQQGDEAGEHEEHDHDCDCGCCGDEDAFFAKIVVGEDGEDTYIEPTDEEFEVVCAAYDAKYADEEDDE